MFNTVDLKLSGPGRTFDDIYLVIIEALKAKGYPVNVVNPYPPELATATEYEEFLAQRNRERIEWVEKNRADLSDVAAETGARPIEKFTVNFKVEHCPWGG